MIFKTNREYITHTLFTEVLKQKVPNKITNQKLLDFVPKEHKQFEKEYVDTWCDIAERTFNLPVKKIKNEPISKIIDQLELKLSKNQKYGYSRSKK